MNNIKQIVIDIMKRHKIRTLKELRKRCMADLYFLVSEILYPKVLGFDELGEVHKELCRFIQESKDFVLLIPRGHFKTTIGTIADSIRLMLIDPNIRILITSATMENCLKAINEIKGHFESNDLFRWIFRDYIWEDFNKATKWSAKKIDLPNKKRYGGEATVEIASVGTEITGRHYDVIKYDDIVAKENSETAGMRDMVKDWFKKSLALLNPKPYNMKHIIGTRWHEDDLYKDILKNETYRQLVLSCYNENGEPIFPERFSKKYLESIKRDLGTYDFSCLYLNDPIPDEMQIFKREWVKYYNNIDKIPLRYYITVDPAISESERADETAICVAGVDNNGIIYIIDMWHGRVGIEALVEKIIRMIQLWKPLKVGIEDVAFQRSLRFYIEQTMRRRGLWTELVGLKGYAKSSKDIRIKRVIPFMERGQMVFNRNLIDLFNQMFRWRGKKDDRDDMLDALAYVIELIDSVVAVYNTEEADAEYLAEYNALVGNSRRRHRISYEDIPTMYAYTSY